MPVAGPVQENAKYLRLGVVQSDDFDCSPLQPFAKNGRSGRHFRADSGICSFFLTNKKSNALGFDMFGTSTC